MKNKRPKGWDLENDFFAYIQSRELSIVATGDLVKNLDLSENQERKLLSSLAKRKLIARVRRGLYLVPPRLPVGGIWSPDEAIALNTLIQDRNGQYQISGLNAFRRYGWDDQIPNRTFVYNDKISGHRTIGANVFDLTKVNSSRLGSVEVVKTSSGYTLIYSSKARALVDAVYDWKRFNSLPEAYRWIRMELTKSNSLASDIVEAALQFSNLSTMKRLGMLLEKLAAPRRLLMKLEKAFPETSSSIPFVPNRPKRGMLNSRWGVVDNDE